MTNKIKHRDESEWLTKLWMIDVIQMETNEEHIENLSKM